MTFIFDLDGTLSDPAVGIGRSINYALDAFGHRQLRDAEVSQHIGPPLESAFRRIVPGASDVAILGMVAKYRERYGNVGYAENVVYPGIPEALDDLASQGISMGVCTSKRADFAERILTLLNLRTYFEFVCGGDVGVPKDLQLRMLLEQGTVDASSTMIGDRAVAVIAARANGIRSVGVLWGHGSKTELVDAGADQLVEFPFELRRLEDYG